jgi:hypothetical protein
MLTGGSLGDCFGNPVENKLPTCQVQRIQRIVSGLSSYKDTGLQRDWFWIDTLCVPSQQVRDPNTRRAVTESMKFITQNATQTIALDSDISLLTPKSEAKEVFIRIAYSSWSSRLWTLQEGVYAQRLYFHFSGKTIDLETLMGKCGGDSPGWELAWEARFPYSELQRYLGNSGSHRVRSEGHCALLLKALEGRATSDRADEPLVIANLLGIDQDMIERKTELSELLRGLGFSATLGDVP